MHRPPRVLLLSRELSALGGVTNFTSMLLQHVRDVELRHQTIGAAPGGALAGALAALRDGLRIAARARREAVDCVHVNPSLNRRSLLRDGWFLALLALARVPQRLVLIHGWDDAAERRLRSSRWRRALFRRTFGAASQIVVLGERFRTALVELGLPRERIAVSSTMFDGRIFAGRERRAGEGLTVLFMARLVPEKGIYELLEAFRRLAIGHPDMRLVVAGEGPERVPAQRWVQAHGLCGRVSFPGYLRGAEKAQCLLDADVFVFPTYHGEGCPVVLLEAMAAGLPLITTAVGGIADVVAGGQSGVVLETAEPDGIARALGALAADPVGRRAMGEFNRTQAWERYEAARVSARFARMYLQAAQRRRGAAVERAAHERP